MILKLWKYIFPYNMQIYLFHSSVEKEKNPKGKDRGILSLHSLLEIISPKSPPESKNINLKEQVYQIIHCMVLIYWSVDIILIEDDANDDKIKKEYVEHQDLIKTLRMNFITWNSKSFTESGAIYLSESSSCSFVPHVADLGWQETNANISDVILIF